MRRLVSDAGLGGAVVVDSAGTGGWHIGEPPDRRATRAGARRGIELGGVARQVGAADFEGFDLLVAMDRSNLRALRSLAPGDASRERVRLLRTASGHEIEVPDPYYGGPEAFDAVLDMVDEGCRELLAELESASRA